MSASLARIDERLSEKRRAVAEMIDSQDRLYAELDSINESLELLDAEQNPSEEDAKAHDQLVAEEKAKSIESNRLASKIRDAQSTISELERQRAERVEFNLRSAEGHRSDRRIEADPVVSSQDARVEVKPMTSEQADHDISSWLRNNYLARAHGVSFADVCAGAIGDDFRNDRLRAVVLKSGNPAVIPPNYLPRLIELLRARSVIRSLPGVRQIPLPNGNLAMPRQTAGSTASYVGEMVNIPKSDVAIGPVTLSAKKLTTLVVASGELLRHSNPTVDAIIRDDMIQQMVLKEDETFLRNAGSSTVPKGIKAFADAVSSTNAIAANQTVNLANVTIDLGKAMLALANSNVPMLNPAWIMSPRSERFLMDLRDGNGNYAFPEMERGTLRGYLYRTTTQIPNNLTVSGTNNTSEIYFLDASELIIGDTTTFQLQVSIEAAYYDGSNVQAAFSQDAAVFRLITEHDTAARHNESFAYLNRVTWGV